MSEFIVIGQRAEDGIAIDFSKPAVGELVRCKDCKKRNTRTCMMNNNVGMNKDLFDDDYCSYGEREDDE